MPRPKYPARVGEGRRLLGAFAHTVGASGLYQRRIEHRKIQHSWAEMHAFPGLRGGPSSRLVKSIAFLEFIRASGNTSRLSPRSYSAWTARLGTGYCI